MIASEQQETLVLMQFPGCFQGFIVGVLCYASFFPGRSAALRAGLRRKEVAFEDFLSRP
jgi:hypothetical protein